MRASAILALALVAERKFGDARSIIRTLMAPEVNSKAAYGDRLFLRVTVGRVLAATGAERTRRRPRPIPGFGSNRRSPSPSPVAVNTESTI